MMHPIDILNHYRLLDLVKVDMSSLVVPKFIEKREKRVCVMCGSDKDHKSDWADDTNPHWTRKFNDAGELLGWQCGCCYHKQRREEKKVEEQQHQEAIEITMGQVMANLFNQTRYDYAQIYDAYFLGCTCMTCMMATGEIKSARPLPGYVKAIVSQASEVPVPLVIAQ